MNDNILELTNKLIHKRTKEDSKYQDKLMQYFKEMELIKKDMEFYEAIPLVLARFSYKDSIYEREIDTTELEETFLKALTYLNKDYKLAIVLCQKVVDIIIDIIIKKENMKKNDNKTINYLIYKRIIPQEIFTIIESFSYIST